MKKFFVAATLLATLLISPQQLANAVIGSPAESCVGLDCKVDFPYYTYQDYYSWTAPQSGTYTFEAWGAQGGDAASNAGGKGGYARGEMTLTAGDTFLVYVGGQGTSSGSGLSDMRAGGYNGGGNSYNGSTTGFRAGGGGGATDFRTIWNNLNTRQLVAGGGAGGIYDSSSTYTNGVGGGLTGGDGIGGGGGSSASGKGGSQSAGGSGGVYFFYANAGTFGNGGSGTSHQYGSAGGGGGWYGGGAGGGYQAAGGGSSYLGYMNNASTINGATSMTQPDGTTAIGRAGNGYARISYTKTPIAMSFSLALPNGTTLANKGVVLTLTATAGQAGKITFYADGKKIPRCISLLTAIGTKTCNWKPTTRKGVVLSATITPTNPQYLQATAQVSIGVTNRGTIR